MNLYAESSAVLAWLLGEEGGEDVREVLAGADQVIASDLTLVECSRVLIRPSVLGEATEAAVADRLAHLNAAATHWHILRIAPEVVNRARQPLPGEPVRTLDALHLASALMARTAVAGLNVLSLDSRIRDCATQLGFDLAPVQAL